MAVTRPLTEGDRLPWLDNRVQRRRRNLRPLLTALLGAVAFAGVATLAFRYGQQSTTGDDAWAGDTVDYSVSRELPPAVVLPQPPTETPQPEPTAATSEAPSSQSARTKTNDRPSRPKRSRPLRRDPIVDSALKKVTADQQAAPQPPKVEHYSGYWPTPATAVRIGRMIQIGTFSNQRRTDAAWQKTVKRYPQVANLPRITSSYRARNGRTYHRLQIMTTAPAQAQWLCRKMRADGRRCTVLGSGS